MTPAKRRQPKPRAKPKAKSRRAAEPKPAATFPQAFASLLRKRKLAVPRGLDSAPPEAYAHQPPAFVEQLAELSDQELGRYAERVASYAGKQADRARAAWEASPLIRELRRRGLPEPPRPDRAAGMNVSLKKSLAEWSDEDILSAAREWSARATR